MPIICVSKEDIMEQLSRRKTIVFYLQVAAAVVSLMIGMFNLTKESKPIVERIQENHRQNQIIKQQQEIVKRATQIAALERANELYEEAVRELEEIEEEEEETYDKYDTKYKRKWDNAA
jgi:DNA repair exonuclease SbcCD ATPase subunit